MKSHIKSNQILPTLLLWLVAIAIAPAAVRYVDLNNPNPSPPFTSWATAATNIQDAVDAAVAGDQILVTNGVYETGATILYGMSNRVAVTKAVTVRSINGPVVTIIAGYQVPGTTNGPAAVRCVSLVDGAQLDGFTLTNGATRDSFSLTGTLGGGVRCGSSSAIVTNCILTSNAAHFYGGGAYSGTLINCTVAGNFANSGGGAYNTLLTGCTLTGNVASYQGAGAYSCTLNDCTLIGNWGLGTNNVSGGGTYGGWLTNCMVIGNHVTSLGNYAASGGGVCLGVLVKCTIAGNLATNYSPFEYGGGAYGGGACQATLYECSLWTNSARGADSLFGGLGGGAYGGTLNDCVLEGNSAGIYGFVGGYGGGASSASLTKCTIGYNIGGTEGGGAFESTLAGCTLTGNKAYNGGGSHSSTLTRCTLIANVAGSRGGGADGGKLINCTVKSNSIIGGVNSGLGGGTVDATNINCLFLGNSAHYGGGAAGYDSDCMVLNCTLVGNSAQYGGGVYRGRLYNSIIYDNSAHDAQEANYSGNIELNNCCTIPALFGTGNITNAPMFVDADAGNYRLQSNSPCIDAGENAVGVGATDLDSRPRFQGWIVDIGAYEFQPGVSGEFIGWLAGYGLPTDGSADYADSDADRMNNWQEWIAGTVPTDAASALRLLTPTPGVSGTLVSWQSVSNRTYFLERTSDLGAQPSFSLLTNNIVGQAGLTTFTDTNNAGPGPFFYRVGIQP